MPVIKNQRHELFAQNIAKGMEGFEAYEKAGYCVTKMKRESVRGAASRVGSIVIVSRRINELKEKSADIAVFDRSLVLQSIKRGMTFDVRQMFDEEGNLKAIPDLPDDMAQSITGMEIEAIWETDEHGNKMQIGVLSKFKFESRSKFTEMGGRHHKLFTDIVKHEGLDGLADDLNAARGRTE